MRLLVLGDIPPWVVGGSEMQTWRLVREWRRQGLDVEIAGHRIPNTCIEGIRLWRLPVVRPLGKAFRALSYASSLSVFLLRHARRFDLIYCRFLGESALVVTLLKSLRFLNLPLVVVPASGGGQGNADAALLGSLPASTKLIRLLSRHVDCANYIAPSVEAAMRHIGFSPERVSRIPNGVSLPATLPGAPIHGVTSILLVGRLAEEKGIDVLLDALTHIIDLEYQVTLVGDGPLRVQLEEQVKTAGLAERIEFAGLLDEEGVSEQLSRSHLFVLPSRYEGLSNAALEAMAHGVPVVVTRCGGIDTYIQPDHGWVCEIEDANSLSAALREALSMDRGEWIRRSKACQMLVKDRFSLEAVAKSYLELFDSLVDENSSIKQR